MGAGAAGAVTAGATGTGLAMITMVLRKTLPWRSSQVSRTSRFGPSLRNHFFLRLVFQTLSRDVMT